MQGRANANWRIAQSNQQVARAWKFARLAPARNSQKSDVESAVKSLKTDGKLAPVAAGSGSTVDRASP